MIQLANGQRMIGFKFVMPLDFPREAPLVFLDEPENAQVVEFVDYVDKGNRIMFNYLASWRPNSAAYTL